MSFSHVKGSKARCFTNYITFLNFLQLSTVSQNLNHSFIALPPPFLRLFDPPNSTMVPNIHAFQVFSVNSHQAPTSPIIYLIRHGEKPPTQADGKDADGLSAQGLERAQGLRKVFGKDSAYDIQYIIAEQPKEGLSLLFPSALSSSCFAPHMGGFFLTAIPHHMIYNFPHPFPLKNQDLTDLTYRWQPRPTLRHYPPPLTRPAAYAQHGNRPRRCQRCRRSRKVILRSRKCVSVLGTRCSRAHCREAGC